MEIQAQDLINQVVAQRNGALDGAAEMAAKCIALQRKVDELEKKIAELSAAKQGDSGD